MNPAEAMALEEIRAEGRRSVTRPQAAHRPGRRDTAQTQRAAASSRCSVDPMQRTDRYRLVTPYFSSSKDL